MNPGVEDRNRTQERARRNSTVPINRGKDSRGPYYKWGKGGRKYHFKAGDAVSRKSARSRASRRAKVTNKKGG